MRIKKGQSFFYLIKVENGRPKVENINKGILEFLVIKKLRSANLEKEIYLAFAPIKLNYLNLMIQKATESWE